MNWRHFVVNGLCFILIGQVINQLTFNMWEYWATISCLLVLSINNMFHKNY